MILLALGCCRVQFGNETCTSLAVTCRGNLNPAPNSTDQSLGMRPDGELLVLGNNGVFAVLTGFDPSPAGLGLLAAYMTRFRAINPDTTCPAIPRYVRPLCASVRVCMSCMCMCACVGVCSHGRCRASLFVKLENMQPTSDHDCVRRPRKLRTLPIQLVPPPLTWSLVTGFWTW